MKYRGVEIGVGLFVLLGLACIFLFIVNISGFALGGTSSYHASYANVSTVEEGTAVKYNGMVVGRVTGLEVDPENSALVRIEMQVRDDITLTEDHEALITSSGLLDAKYVDIRVSGHEQGSAPLRTTGAAIPDGGRLRSVEPFDVQVLVERLGSGVDDLSSFLDDTQGHLDAVVERVNGLLDEAGGLFSDENKDNVQQALSGLRRSTDRLNSILDENSDRLADLLESGKSATANMNELTEKLNGRVDELSPELRSLVDSLQEAAGQLNSTLDKADSTIDTLDVQRLNDLIENLERASRNLVAFTNKVKNDPSSVIRGEKRKPKQFR